VRCPDPYHPRREGRLIKRVIDLLIKRAQELGIVLDVE
jgi:hypothetical protein